MLLGTTAAALLAARRVLHDWGATKAECRATLPGDELVPDPALTTTRAVTIAAAADEVWRWLVQIGQDRGGMYSYDWLENLVGLDIRSTELVKAEWQDLAVGDTIRLARPGWLGRHEGYGVRVAQLDPPRTLVLVDDAWPSVWSFHLRALGAHRCRLVSRSRAPRASGPRALLGEALDPVTLLMTRAMLLGIKRRAEDRDRAARELFTAA